MPGLIKAPRQARQWPFSWAAPWKARTVDTFSTLLFPPGGRDCQAVLASVCCAASSGAGTRHPALLFSVVHRYGEYVGFHLCSEIGKTEASSSGSLPMPPKEVTTLEMWSSLFFSSPRKSWELGVSSQSCSTVPERETLVRLHHKLSYSLQCGWFHTCEGCRSLWTVF